MQKFKSVLWALAILLFFTACEDCTFTSKNTDDIVIGFFIKDDFGNALPEERVFDSIRTGALHLALELATNEDGDALAFTASTLNLPADPTRDTSEFYFFSDGDTLVTDTIIFLYRRKIEIITPDCGYDLQFLELEILKNTFGADSVALPKNVLTVGDEKNLEIYTR